MTEIQIQDYCQPIQGILADMDANKRLVPRRRVINMQRSVDPPEELQCKDADELRSKLKNFRSLCNDENPLTYISKYAFAERLLQIGSKISTEALLLFLTDRSFYFEEYRRVGDLPGNPISGTSPVPNTNDFIRGSDLLDYGKMTPAEILNRKIMEIEGRIKQSDRNQCTYKMVLLILKNHPELSNGIPEEYKDNMELLLQRYKIPEESEEDILCCLEDKSWNEKKCQEWLETVEYDLKWMPLVRDVYCHLKIPPPSFLPTPDDVDKAVVRRCEKHNIKIPDLRDRKAEFLTSYKREYEKYRRIRIVIDREWIPTNIHHIFYKESETNYEKLKEQLQRREDEMRSANRLLKKLNQLSNAVPYQRKDSFELSGITKKVFPSIILIFETYVCTLLHRVRKEAYLPILEYQNTLDIREKPYAVAIYYLLKACDCGKKWHELTPLFMYIAFSNNTKAILNNSGSKLVRKISVANEAARVQNMASMTGYRAEANLVLYQKLKSAFSSSISTQRVCILDRDSEYCEKNAYADIEIRNRMDFDSCTKTEKAMCPFGRSAYDWNDFGFYLITGYGALYHHALLPDDTVNISANQICKAQLDEDNADEPIPEEKKYPIYRYLFDLRHPVGTLENLLEHHIQNCILNRPRYLLTTSPMAYNSDVLHLPYEELSNLLLQDMHLPAQMRICWKVQHLLSEHPEYLEKYQCYLRYPCLMDYAYQILDNIIKSHGLKEQARRYTDYSLSFKNYQIDDSLYAILGYEMRAKLIDRLRDPLRRLTYQSLSPKLFAYPLAKTENTCD